MLFKGLSIRKANWLMPRNIDNTILGVLLEAGDKYEDELYRTVDWQSARQKRIENKLADRHLHNGGRVLYDQSSSYFEGCCCTLTTYECNCECEKANGRSIMGC